MRTFYLLHFASQPARRELLSAALTGVISVGKRNAARLPTMPAPPCPALPIFRHSSHRLSFIFVSLASSYFLSPPLSVGSSLSRSSCCPQRSAAPPYYCFDKGLHLLSPPLPSRPGPSVPARGPALWVPEVPEVLAGYPKRLGGRGVNTAQPKWSTSSTQSDIPPVSVGPSTPGVGF